MNYPGWLLAQLKPVADGAIVFVKQEWGLTKFRIGEKVDPLFTQLALFHTTMADHHILWIDISESPWPKYMDAIVVDCRDNAIPVRFLVAIPKDIKGAEYDSNLSRARQKGVGVLAVGANDAELLVSPLSLSLSGLQPISKAAFPNKLKFHLSQAEQTFRSGNPNKGCNDLYDLIEAESRRIARRTFEKGLWKTGAAALKWKKDPWHSVLEAAIKSLMPPSGTSVLVLHRTLGSKDTRNESAHLIQNKEQLKKRDKELRIRFEDASRLLIDLISLSKSLGI
jgi:hypothetical protein